MSGKSRKQIYENWRFCSLLSGEVFDVIASKAIVYINKIVKHALYVTFSANKISFELKDIDKRQKFSCWADASS